MALCHYITCPNDASTAVEAIYRSPGGKRSRRTARVCDQHEERAVRELTAIGYLVHTRAADRNGAGIGLTACCHGRMEAGRCHRCGQPAEWARAESLDAS